MNRYKVESVRELGGDRFETHLVAPGNHCVVINQYRPGATLEEMQIRADMKAERMNLFYTDEKFDNQTSPYRTTNKALLEDRMKKRQ